MATAGTLTFAHRYSRDGKVESICLECLTTIGRSRNAMKALEEEAAHVCKPEVVMAPGPAEQPESRYAYVFRDDRRSGHSSRKPNAKVNRYSLASSKASRG